MGAPLSALWAPWAPLLPRARPGTTLVWVTWESAVDGGLASRGGLLLISEMRPLAHAPLVLTKEHAARPGQPIARECLGRARRRTLPLAGRNETRGRRDRRGRYTVHSRPLHGLFEAVRAIESFRLCGGSPQKLVEPARISGRVVDHA